MAGDTDASGSAARAATASLAAETDRLAMCIHCGFCLDDCPTYTRGGDESDSPRGRLYLMRAVAEGRIPPSSDAFARHLDRCLGCRACEPVCPSGVEYGFLLERGREAIARTRGIPGLERMLLATFGNPTLNAITGLLARVVRATGLARLVARVAPARFRRVRMAAAMLEASRPWNGLKSVRSARTDADEGGSAHQGPLADATAGTGPDSSTAADAATPARRTTATALSVALFEGCVQKTLFARVNGATARVLRWNGHAIVSVGGQRCCGALHAHAGDLDGARDLARRNLAAFAPLIAGDDGERRRIDAIIVNAAGCGAMMKDWGKLFEGRPEHELAVAVSSRVRDPLVFLSEHGVRPGRPLELRAAWDSPCHLLHGQRSGSAPLDALRAAIPGLDVTPVPRADECCGGAGIHALVHGGYGDRVLADKLDAVRSVQADIALSANPGCIMQIGGGLLLAGEKVRCVHPVELMDALDRRAAGWQG